MVYTLTFSPSIDYVMDIASLNIGDINRSFKEAIYPGGKGINVSLVLNNLGHSTCPLGFVAGFTGDYIVSSLKSSNIKPDFINIPGNSRINVKLRSKKETAINANGPIISDSNIKELLSKIKEIPSNSYLVISGNVPSTIRRTIYEEILQILSDKDVKVVVDATNDLLLNTLKYNPFLIKPNIDELEEMFDVKIKNNDDLFKYMKKLKKMGAKNVVVSLGAGGACMLTCDNVIHCLPSPKGKLVNSVGAGDSLIAGFLAGLLEGKDLFNSFVYGVLAGSATAYKEHLCNKEDILKLEVNYEYEN